MSYSFTHNFVNRSILLCLMTMAGVTAALSQASPVRLSTKHLHARIDRCVPVSRLDSKGVVRVYLVIDKTGRVIRANPLNGHPLVRKMVKDAVLKWTFRPYLKAGRAKWMSGIVKVNVGSVNKDGIIDCI
ncbi:MAG: hypothetical protein WBD16_02005 [Pyrinomonadaceae bacterium]